MNLKELQNPLSTDLIYSSNVYDIKFTPFPVIFSGLNSMTVSFKPPVLVATTGVEPMKNSCYTIPPGSKSEGIKPKSQPQFNKEPSI